MFSAGGSITLRCSATAAGTTWRHRWRIAAAPPGVQAQLHGARTARPELVATTPGTYRIRTRVAAPNGSFSIDTGTADFRQPEPPLGWPLRTSDDRGTITLDGGPIAGTTWPCASGSYPNCPAYMSWAVLSRRTLEVKDADHRLGDAAGVKDLTDRIVAKYLASPYYIVVVNLSGSSAALPDGVRLLKLLGRGHDRRLAPPSRGRSRSSASPGSPAGSAFMSDPRIQCSMSNPPCPAAQPQGQANMTGYLRLNFDRRERRLVRQFVFDDQVAFNIPTPRRRTRGHDKFAGYDL